MLTVCQTCSKGFLCNTQSNVVSISYCCYSPYFRQRDLRLKVTLSSVHDHLLLGQGHGQVCLKAKPLTDTFLHYPWGSGKNSWEWVGPGPQIASHPLSQDSLKQRWFSGEFLSLPLMIWVLRITMATSLSATGIVFPNPGFSSFPLLGFFLLSLTLQGLIQIQLPWKPPALSIDPLFL